MSLGRLPFMMTLLFSAGLGVAAEPTTSSEFPNPSQAYFGLAKVAARPGKSVRFSQLLESQCAEGSTCSESDLSLKDGDQVVTGGVEGKRAYAWFRGRGRYLRGWLPTASLEQLPFAAQPASKSWEGTWTHGEWEKITIESNASTSELIVAAYAEWHGGANGEVVHTGDVQGKAVPDGNRLVIRTGADPFDCILELELLDELLAVQDNMHCGGMNVGFSDVYEK